MKKFILVILIVSLLVLSVSCSHDETAQNGETDGTPFGVTEPERITEATDAPQTQGTTVTTVTDTDMEHTVDYLAAPDLMLTNADGENIRLYAEMVCIEIPGEGFYADGYLIFNSVSSRLPAIADVLPDVEIGAFSDVNIILPSAGDSVMPVMRFRLYSDEDYSLIFEAESMEDIYEYCRTSGKYGPFYLCVWLETTYENVGALRRDAYFAKVSLAREAHIMDNFNIYVISGDGTAVSAFTLPSYVESPDVACVLTPMMSASEPEIIKRYREKIPAVLIGEGSKIETEILPSVRFSGPFSIDLYSGEMRKIGEAPTLAWVYQNRDIYKEVPVYAAFTVMIYAGDGARRSERCFVRILIEPV